jgi:signal transduction histidine kinase
LRWEAGETPVPGTAGRLRQVLDNLIGNAIEHGGGRVLVRGEAVPDSVRVTVSDEGRGLPIQPDDWIEAPWRSARGHGLAISRAMIAAYGGRLAARTTADGPGVAFELPLLAHAPSISSRERVAPPRQRRKEGSAEAIAGAGGRRAA